jgi:hypothetical protein
MFCEKFCMYLSSAPMCCVHHMPNLFLFGQPNNILWRVEIVDISNKAKEHWHKVIVCEVAQATFAGFKNVWSVNVLKLSGNFTYGRV